MGRETFDRFHAAWKRNDRPAMRRHLASGVQVGSARAARKAPDCSYRAGEPSWFCWVEMRGGFAFGVRLDVTHHQRPDRPRWKVTAIAPDV